MKWEDASMIWTFIFTAGFVIACGIFPSKEASANAVFVYCYCWITVWLGIRSRQKPRVTISYIDTFLPDLRIPEKDANSPQSIRSYAVNINQMMIWPVAFLWLFLKKIGGIGHRFMSRFFGEKNFQTLFCFMDESDAILLGIPLFAAWLSANVSPGGAFSYTLLFFAAYVGLKHLHLQSHFVFRFIRQSWIDHAIASNINWTIWGQLSIQFMGLCATVALAVIATGIICIVVEKTVGFRVDQETEINGLDYSLHGEHGYGLLGPR